jgi:hypothetical protein
MRALAFIAAVTFALAGLLPAAAHARSQTITVEILGEPPASQPVVGAKVEILDQDGNLLGGGVTDDKGEARIQFELPDGVGRVIIGTDVKGRDGGSTYASLHLQSANPEGFTMHFSASTTWGEASAPAILAKRAIAKCDKTEYDRWVAEANRRVGELERRLDDAQKQADEFARQNNLHVTDLKGAQKDRKRAEKAQEQIDPSARNRGALRLLAEYIEMLEGVEATKKKLDEARRARDAIPPFPDDCKKDKHVMAPGTGQCPDGSGGMLAGALNQIFDSDLAAACTDKSHRRETEREKHEDHKGGKKD